MTNSTRNILRIVSIVIVIFVVLEKFKVLPDVGVYDFWLMLVAYGLLLFTVKR